MRDNGVSDRFKNRYGFRNVACNPGQADVLAEICFDFLRLITLNTGAVREPNCLEPVLYEIVRPDEENKFAVESLFYEIFEFIEKIIPDHHFFVSRSQNRICIGFFQCRQPARKGFADL